MTWEDRAFIAGCAVVAGFLGTDPPMLGELIAYAALGLLLLGPTRTKVQRQPEPNVATAISELCAAGFTEEQAKELAREVVRNEVRKQGGWKP